MAYLSYPLIDDVAPHQSMAALWLSREGMNVDFFAWGNEPPPAWLLKFPAIRYRTFRKRGIASAISAARALRTEIHRSPPQVLYVQGAQNAPLALAAIVGGGTRARLVYHTQDYLEPGRHPFYESCERALARRADVVISNEENRARFMASSYRLGRFPEVVRTALPTWWSVPVRDPDRRVSLLDALGLAGEKAACLIAAGGHFDETRMSSELLQAVARLPGRYGVVFTGQPRTAASKAVFQRARADAGGVAVIALDLLGYEELLRVYAACDIGVLLYPNSGVGHFYQAPGRLTEFLRCGLPVVTSNFPGLELLVQKHGIGATADPYDSGAIARAIATLDVGEEAAAERRQRLSNLACTTLAYDENARAVFGKVLGEAWPGR